MYNAQQRNRKKGGPIRCTHIHLFEIVCLCLLGFVRPTWYVLILTAAHSFSHSTFMVGCSTKFPGRKIFVGNGRVASSRLALFKQEKPKGVFVEMITPLYWAPSLDQIDKRLVPQNVPSCLAVHELDPK